MKLFGNDCERNEIEARKEMIENKIDFYIAKYHCSGYFIENGKLKYDEQKRFNEYVELDKVGISIASYQIGYYYKNSKIIGKDNQKSLEYFKKSAKQGYRWGYHGVAFFSTGNEKQENLIKKFHLFKRLADNGWNYNEFEEPRRKVIEFLEKRIWS